MVSSVLCFCGILLIYIAEVLCQIESGLFPGVFNLATNALVTANATCGASHPEEFCKLVEHVRRRPTDRVQCGVCDASAYYDGLTERSDLPESHPVEFITDGTDRWWQSPTIANGLQYHAVTVTLDLKQMYQIAYVVFKAGNSPRPGNWVLEKSLDGIAWQPWQYYAMSDSACWSVYGVKPTIGIPRPSTDSEVICTSYYSRLDPLEGGEIHTSLVNGRPGVNGPSDELMEFTTARYIRLRLQRIRTLNADLMTFLVNRPELIPASVANRYFYSIKDISIGGQCICFGHASRCPADPLTGEWMCECEQNTCGRTCETCCPMYNQQPWQSGTYEHGAICEECNCFGHADSCVYNETVSNLGLSLNIQRVYSGGGVCQDCRDNTMGINCELCADGFYRPIYGESANDLSVRAQYACVPCDCNEGVGTTGLCVKESSCDVDAMCAGDCICRPGYAGPRCDRCEFGYSGYPSCTPCLCNPRGSVNPDPCEGDCVCKANVCGDQCDMCADGFFNLRSDNPMGCDVCFCMEISMQCNSSTEQRKQIVSMDDWLLTDLAATSVVRPSQVGRPAGIRPGVVEGWRTVNNETQGVLGNVVYWKAPSGYTGNKVKSYGGILEYAFKYEIEGNDPGNNEQLHLGNYDIIIQGSGMTLGHNGAYFPSRVDNLIKFEFTEHEWRHVPETSFTPLNDQNTPLLHPEEYQYLYGEDYNYQPGRDGVDPLTPSSPYYDSYNDDVSLDEELAMLVTREEFMLVLARVDRMLVRATYHLQQTSSTLYHVVLDTAVDSGGGGEVMSAVEVCSCPPGYAGTSCESCAPGFRRIDDILLGGQCEPCECNGHSDHCDPFNAECIDCGDNTAGFQCEFCAPGFYGSHDACMPCECPFTADIGSYATECVLETLAEMRHTCVNCQAGYEGDHCELCAYGYYGSAIDFDNPDQPGVGCIPCNCNNHGDPESEALCDITNGTCTNCVDNTRGEHCEECREGFYRNRDGQCVGCDCNNFGSVSQECDLETGQCACLEMYEGRDCGQCLPGHGNIAQGCPVCNCTTHLGALPDLMCDSVTGQCVCKPGVTGIHCHTCKIEFWDYSPYGCSDCGCFATGANSTHCDITTGVCECLPNVRGEKCQTCEENHWDLFSGAGCQSCACDSQGSTGAGCDLYTGQCECRAGVSGRSCDQCTPGFYDFTDLGCRECAPCPVPGYVCDAVTGDCICPPNTEGDYCERCSENTWGHNLNTGCQDCDCNAVGSTSAQCHLDSGQCFCYKEYRGLQCDQCMHAHYGYPSCRSCDCLEAGTKRAGPEGAEPEVCNEQGQCQCDEDGQCPCKSNVEGIHCDRCVSGSFSLQTDNSDGCTTCFCSGKSQICEQAEHYWSDKSILSLHTVNVTQNHVHIVSPNAYRILPIPVNGITDLTVIPGYEWEPLYWVLPSAIRGDQMLSYNGYLRFTLTSEPATNLDLTSTPLIHIIANTVLHLHYTHSTTGPHYVQGDVLNVRLHEEFWLTSDNQAVSREQFLVALQRIEAVYVLAAQNSNVRSLSISAVSLDVSLPISDGEELNAFGVESCECPEEYSGLSCQNPADGYYRLLPSELSLVQNLTDLLGVSEPCFCNDHSETCDPETAYCKNCRHNTQGQKCDECADGYHGDATNGIFGCQRCACPLLDPVHNYSPTCVDLADGYHVCDACAEGYNGTHCETCAAGFYGHALTVGCLPCNCNPQGSVSAVCDPSSGVCSCVTGIRGEKCDECEPRYAVVDGQCQSCDSGCTADLMLDMDFLDQAIAQYNESALHYIPYRYLDHVGNLTATFRKSLGGANFTELRNAVEIFTEIQDLQEQIEQQNSSISDSGAELIAAAAGNKEDVEHFVREINETDETLRDFMSSLSDLVQEQLLGNATLPGNAQNMAELVERGENEIEDIQRLDSRLTDIDDSVNRELASCDEMLANSLVEQSRTNSVEGLDEIINDIDEKLQDLQTNINLSGDNNRLTTIKNNENRRLMEEIYRLLDHTNVSQSVVEDLIHDALVLNDQSNYLIWNETSEIYTDTVDLWGDLNAFIEPLDEIGETLSNEIPVIKPVLYQAELHADNLRTKSDQLNHLMSSTSEAASDPVKAANVYETISEAIHEANDAAVNASNAAEQALDEVNLDSGSLPDMALASLQRSRDLRNEALLLNKNQRERMDVTIDNNEQIDVDNEETERLLTDVHSGLDDMTTGSIPEADMLDLSQRANNSATLALETATDVELIQQSMDQGLLPKLDTLTTNLETADLPTAIQQVRSVVDDLNEVNNMTALLEKVDTINDLHLEIENSLAELKESIRITREQANNIKVSLSPEGDCVRTYKPTNLKSSTTNNVVLHFKTDHPHHTMMLFYIGKQRQSEDLLAIELVNRRVRFSWNVGGGTHSIEHTQQIDRQNWYQVTVQRYGSEGSISVQLSEDMFSEDLLERHYTAPPSPTQLTIHDDTEVYIGGLPHHYRLPSPLVAHTFRGCVGTVSYNGRNIGMYNFNNLTGNACSGCTPISIRQPTSNHFDGSGFAEVEPPRRYDDSAFMIKMEIKSFWENSLLFFSHNEELGDFVALEMRDGHLVFSMSLGDDVYSITADDVYNTNSWVNLTATWFKDTDDNGAMLLKVRREIKQFNVPRDSDLSLDLNGKPIYYGGLPMNIDAERYNITATSFLGCMKNLKYSSRSSLQPVLLNGRNLGVQPNCENKNPSKIGFGGDSYIEYDRTDLRDTSSIAFTFRTKQADALILLATGQDYMTFYSVSLSRGQISAWLRNGQDEMITVGSTDAYNDNEPHSVSIQKIGRDIILYIDDELSDSSRIVSGSSRISVFGGGAEEGGLYFGGVPAEIDIGGRAASTIPFQGCISDIIINNQPLSLQEPRSFSRADVGRCEGDLSPGNDLDFPTTTPSSFFTVTVPTQTTPATTRQPPTSCARRVRFGHIDGAAGFGDSVHSHVEIVVNKNEIHRNFNVSFEIRTTYTRSLLFYISNELRSQYLAIQVTEAGTIKVVYHDKSTFRYVESDINVIDGRWHHIWLDKTEKKINLHVDFIALPSTRITKKLDVIAPVYVGGLPRAYRVGPNVESESYKGCMREFRLNGVYEDLLNSKALMGIRQCYEQVEHGVYFSYGAHAIYDDHYTIASTFSVSLEFRTRKRSGIILSISHNRGRTALALEIFDGQVQFSVRNDDGLFTAVSEECDYCLCDNRWHHVEAEFIENVARLRVDHGKLRIASGAGHKQQLNAVNVLYIGGLPEYLSYGPHGALSTTDPFTGCIRELAINGTRAHWHGMHSLVDAQIAGCPIT